MFGSSSIWTDIVAEAEMVATRTTVVTATVSNVIRMMGTEASPNVQVVAMKMQ